MTPIDLIDLYHGLRHLAAVVERHVRAIPHAFRAWRMVATFGGYTIGMYADDRLLGTITVRLNAEIDPPGTMYLGPGEVSINGRPVGGVKRAKVRINRREVVPLDEPFGEYDYLPGTVSRPEN